MGQKVARLFLDITFIAILAAALTYGTLTILEEYRLVQYVLTPGRAIRDVPFIVACVLLAIGGVTSLSCVLSFIFFFRKAGWSWVVMNGVLIFIVICLAVYVALRYYGVNLTF